MNLLSAFYNLAQRAYSKPIVLQAFFAVNIVLRENSLQVKQICQLLVVENKETPEILVFFELFNLKIFVYF